MFEVAILMSGDVYFSMRAALASLPLVNCAHMSAGGVHLTNRQPLPADLLLHMHDCHRNVATGRWLSASMGSNPSNQCIQMFKVVFFSQL